MGCGLPWGVVCHAAWPAMGCGLPWGVSQGRTCTPAAVASTAVHIPGILISNMCTNLPLLLLLPPSLPPSLSSTRHPIPVSLSLSPPSSSLLLSPHLLESWMSEVTLMTFFSRLRDTSLPRLPALPFTLIRPLKKSSCGGRGEAGEEGRRGEEGALLGTREDSPNPNTARGNGVKDRFRNISLNTQLPPSLHLSIPLFTCTSLCPSPSVPPSLPPPPSLPLRPSLSPSFLRSHLVAYKCSSVHYLILHWSGAVDGELQLRLLGLAPFPLLLLLLVE